MKRRDERRVERLIASATGSLNRAGPWLVGTSVPDQKGTTAFVAAPTRIQTWLLNHVSTWPAPLGVGANLSLESSETIAFSSMENEGEPAHYCALYADGSSLLAVQIGVLRKATESRDAVWSIGEGAVAWLSVAFVRLAAAWAAQAGVIGDGVCDLRLFSTASPKDQLDIQLWNSAGGANAPASDQRQMTKPSKGVINLRSGLSAQAALTARTLLLPLLNQFGQEESRHIDGAGVVIGANFAGHAPAIAAWARAIGIACR